MRHTRIAVLIAGIALGVGCAGEHAHEMNDARVLIPGLDLSGDEVASFVDDFYGGGGEVISVEFRTYDLFIHEEAAYELGQYEETARFGDQEPESVAGNYFLRWERQTDGTWRIDRFVAGPIAAGDE